MSEVTNVEEEIVKVKIKGIEYSFEAPGSKVTRSVRAEFKAASHESYEGDPIDIYINFLVKLGLPKEVIEALSDKKIMEVFGIALGSKKN